MLSASSSSSSLVESLQGTYYGYGQESIASSVSHFPDPSIIDKSCDWLEIDVRHGKSGQHIDMRAATETDLLNRADAARLHEYIKKSDLDQIHHFLKTERECLIDIPDKNGMAALHMAIVYSDVKHREKIIRLLLHYNADVNAPMGSGKTPLMAAVAFGRHANLVKVLLDAGADPNQQDKYGNTARTVARETQRKSLYALLDI